MSERAFRQRLLSRSEQARRTVFDQQESRPGSRSRLDGPGLRMGEPAWLAGLSHRVRGPGELIVVKGELFTENFLWQVMGCSSGAPRRPSFHLAGVVLFAFLASRPGRGVPRGSAEHEAGRPVGGRSSRGRCSWAFDDRDSPGCFSREGSGRGGCSSSSRGCWAHGASLSPQGTQPRVVISATELFLRLCPWAGVVPGEHPPRAAGRSCKRARVRDAAGLGTGARGAAEGVCAEREVRSPPCELTWSGFPFHRESTRTARSVEGPRWDLWWSAKILFVGRGSGRSRVPPSEIRRGAVPWDQRYRFEGLTRTQQGVRYRLPSHDELAQRRFPRRAYG
jgi:hypothetical protein